MNRVWTAYARVHGRDMDATELREQDSVLCCAAAPVTAMQFQPRRDGLLVRSPAARARRSETALHHLKHCLSLTRRQKHR